MCTHCSCTHVSEGGNNGLRLIMGCVKPVIWKWIETIHKVQIKSDFKINQFMCGGSNVSKKKSEIKRQESMSRLVRDYSFVDPGQRLGFVRKMSHFSSSQKRRRWLETIAFGVSDFIRVIKIYQCLYEFINWPYNLFHYYWNFIRNCFLCFPNKLEVVCVYLHMHMNNITPVCILLESWKNTTIYRLGWKNIWSVLYRVIFGYIWLHTYSI